MTTCSESGQVRKEAAIRSLCRASESIERTGAFWCRDLARSAARCLVVERSRRRSRGPARHQTPRRRPGQIAAPKSARALDGFGCPTEAPYGCFLPDLTRFGTCRHPNPSNALGARYILPAPARQSKVANLGRSFFDYFCSPIARAANE